MSYKIDSFIANKKEVPSYEKNISICLEANGFSFSVVSEKAELLTLGQVSFSPNPSMSEAMQMVRGAFSECGIVPFGLRSVELIVPSQQFVLVPDHLYEAGKEREYLDALCTVPAGMAIFVDHSELIGAQVVFAAENTLASAFKIALPGLKVRCQYSKMVNATLKERSDLRSLLLLHLRKGFLDVAVYCNKSLQLCNSYPVENVQEVIFHALNVAKQLHLEDALMTPLVCGDIDRLHFNEMAHYLAGLDLYCGRDLKIETHELRQLPLYRHALILS